MEICNYNDCTGCGACASICPQGCISLKLDCYGELHPVVEEKKCVQCKKCIGICPSITVPQLITPIDVYASWRLEVSKMTDSASGGVGAVFSENWVKQGGTVFGTKFDESFHAIICGARTLESIEAFKGSKYVQSETKNSFLEIKNLLAEGEKVLFFGTPCQLAGLYAVVNRHDPNLVTVEILCHGVSSDAYLQEELEFLKKRLKGKSFDKLTFRTNRWMMDYFFGLWKENKIVYHQPADENEYFRGFLTGLTLRESCYQCNYKRIERLGDICIGDFIGVGKHVAYEGENESPSLILVMTRKGTDLIELSKKDLVLMKRTIEEAIIDGISLRESFPRHKKQKAFRELYKNKGFVMAIHETIGDEIAVSKKQNRILHIKRKIKFFINSIFGIKIKNGKIYHGE